MSEKNLFETLSSINVNDKTEKKSNLTYLSWSFAWAEFKKVCPTATYKIKEYGEDKKPYLYDENFGIMVMTSVTVGTETHEMWLFVMDGANKAMKTKPYTYQTRYGEKECAAATMFDINKTLMRCLVKNLAMFGLGIYIYAGEDLPEGYVEPPKKKTLNASQFDSGIKSIEEGKYTIEQLISDFDLDESQMEIVETLKK
jgi:hypothetical protein